nr:MAG TPA: hypothetical protein [Caudoviricetes sp.]
MDTIGYGLNRFCSKTPCFPVSNFGQNKSPKGANPRGFQKN